MKEGEIWNEGVLASLEADKPLALCSSEQDAQAVIDGAHMDAIAVPRSHSWTERWRERLGQIKEIVLATGFDDAGLRLSNELAGIIGPERCSFVSDKYGAALADLAPAAMASTFADRKPWPVKGLYRLSDFPEPAPVTELRSRLNGIRDLWPLTLGTFSVITGWQGIGKTSLLAWIMADYLKQGVRMAVGSFETQTKPVLLRKMRASMLEVPFDDPRAAKECRFDAMLDDRMMILSQYCADEEVDMTLEELIEKATIAVIRHGVKLIIIDPWNEIEHKHGRDESEHEYTGRAIRMIKRFCRRYNVAVWLVAHPKKPPDIKTGPVSPPGLYSVSGSAHFANKADYGVTIHRDSQTSDLIQFMVTKVRMGLPGRPGSATLGFNHNTGGYDLEYMP